MTSDPESQSYFFLVTLTWWVTFFFYFEVLKLLELISLILSVNPSL